MNDWKRLTLAVLSVPLLAAPSAYGVYLYLAPESGYFAMSAAVGFELLYIGVNVLTLRSEALRQYAQGVALAAVITAVVFNTLAHYALKVPGAYTGAPLSALAALLSLITSLPLAGLAYAVSVLLHNLSDDTPVSTPSTERQGDVNVTVQTLVAPSSDVKQLVDTPAKVLTPGVNVIDSPRHRVKALVDSGLTVKAAAAEVGVSRQTASKYMREES